MPGSISRVQRKQAPAATPPGIRQRASATGTANPWLVRVDAKPPQRDYTHPCRLRNISRVGAGRGRATRSSLLEPMLLSEQRRRTTQRASHGLATARGRLARLDLLP